MREIMSQFGGTVVTLVIASFCCILLYGASNYGQYVTSSGSGLQTLDQRHTEYEAIKGWYQRVPPKGESIQSERFYVGEPIGIERIGRIVDMEGDSYSLNSVVKGTEKNMKGEIVELKDGDNESWMSLYNHNEATITPTKAGVYELEVAVKDRENTEAVIYFLFVVDQLGGVGDANDND